MAIETLRVILYWGGMIIFLGLELVYSYRTPTVSKWKRWLTNVPLAAINGFLYYSVYHGLLQTQMQHVTAEHMGLLNLSPLPLWSHLLLGVLVLDFVIYLWHLLNHVVPILWRFHRVHHSDLNMDASTANRFHLGELLLSGLVRLAAVYTFGISAIAYLYFEIIANLAIQFHHSSMKVAPWFEKIWITLFVPPSMHRIHHSVKIRERDANYGVLFSVWDRFLGTLVMDVDQQKIVIGLGSHRNFDKLDFTRLWLLPFTRNTR